MESILEELFLGGIHPSEDNTVVCDEEYSEALSRLCELEGEIKKALAPENIELFTQYSNQSNTLGYVTAKNYFILGFRLGSKVMAAALE